MNEKTLRTLSLRQLKELEYTRIARAYADQNRSDPFAYSRMFSHLSNNVEQLNGDKGMRDWYQSVTGKSSRHG